MGGVLRRFPFFKAWNPAILRGTNWRSTAGGYGGVGLVKLKRKKGGSMRRGRGRIRNRQKYVQTIVVSYSIFEAHGSFSSIGGGLSGLHP